MGNPVSDIFRTCWGLLANCPFRQGNCLEFQADDQIVYAGDLHGHRGNLAKLIAYCKLDSHPHRRLVLQEIIHGGPAAPSGADRSFDLLLRAARLKLAHPKQVFFLLGNHDLAQCTGNEITKEGRGVCRAFRQGLQESFGQDAVEVHDAMAEMLLAMPLAARCPNGVMMSHSLPSPERMGLIDWSILDRPYQKSDFLRGGSVYEWVWGRRHLAEAVDEMARRLGVKLFLLGHQPQEQGCHIVSDQAVILDTTHAHGCVAVFRGDEELTAQSLADKLLKVARL